MHRLDASDERRVGRFVVETAEIGSDDEPFPAAFLTALRRLVPCDDVAFGELERMAERALARCRTPRSSSSRARAAGTSRSATAPS